MSVRLEIAVTLLTNRFHGKEWPCSPARLFRALVAGSTAGGTRQHTAETEQALRWLEGQNAPEISVANSSKTSKYRISVPNNDMDTAAREWLAGKAYDPAQLRTLKTVPPREFACDGPHISFRWREAKPNEEILSGLRRAVESLHTLGWGIDMAFADLRIDGKERSGEVQWSPADVGPILEIPITGSLDDLRATYGRFLAATTRAGVDADTRPSVYGVQRYSHGRLHLDHIEFAIGDIDEPRFRSFPAEQTMIVAAWLRHAAAQSMREERYPEDVINSLALGHDETEQNLDRLIYLPVCSVGSEHADGRIRRAIIALRGRSELLHLLKRKLNGRVLTGADGSPVCRLSVPSSQKVTPQYLRAQQEWATVTPVILHGHNASRGIVSLRKSEKLLQQAFEQAGYRAQDIEKWAFQPAPFWGRTPSASGMRVPRHLERWPRYHVWVQFREKVHGPVLAGIGRHYGIGVFAGWDQSSR